MDVKQSLPHPDQDHGKRTVYAPSDRPSVTPTAVISVELASDEEVEWIWTHLADGDSVVTGYSIRKTEPEKKN